MTLLRSSCKPQSGRPSRGKDLLLDLMSAGALLINSDLVLLNFQYIVHPFHTPREIGMWHSLKMNSIRFLLYLLHLAFNVLIFFVAGQRWKSPIAYIRLPTHPRDQGHQGHQGCRQCDYQQHSSAGHGQWQCR